MVNIRNEKFVTIDDITWMIIIGKKMCESSTYKNEEISEKEYPFPVQTPRKSF